MSDSLESVAESFSEYLRTNTFVDILEESRTAMDKLHDDIVRKIEEFHDSFCPGKTPLCKEYFVQAAIDLITKPETPYEQFPEFARTKK